MQWTAIQRNWPAFTEALMQRFPETEENDLLGLEGDRAALVDYIAQRHELARPEAERQVKEWEQGAVPADVAMDDIRESLAELAHYRKTFLKLTQQGIV